MFLTDDYERYSCTHDCYVVCEIIWADDGSWYHRRDLEPIATFRSRHDAELICKELNAYSLGKSMTDPDRARYEPVRYKQTSKKIVEHFIVVVATWQVDQADYDL